MFTQKINTHWEVTQLKNMLKLKEVHSKGDEVKKIL